MSCPACKNEAKFDTHLTSTDGAPAIQAVIRRSGDVEVDWFMLKEPRPTAVHTMRVDPVICTECGTIYIEQAVLDALVGVQQSIDKAIAEHPRYGDNIEVEA